MSAHPLRPSNVFLAASILLSAAWGLRAEEPEEVLLVRPDSLVGWDYGDSGTEDWKIKNGRLTAAAGAKPLLSGFSFGDFRVDLNWSAEGGGLLVDLPDVPQGVGLRVSLREGDGCGRIIDEDKQVAAGKKVDPAGKDKLHTATIERAGGKLSVTVDGQEVAAVDVAPKRRFGLGLSTDGAAATVEDLRMREPAGEPIFNGKNLDGWWCPGDLGAWKADSGELILFQRGGNYLRTKKEFGNFTLTLDYRIRARGNSGIGIRTPHDGWPSGDGMELQIEDKPAMNKHATMAIYGNMPPLARADKSEDWNRVVVKADGPMISAWVNGQLVQHCNTRFQPELQYRNLQGWIGFQDHGAETHFRNIRVLEAPAGLGLEAWKRPPKPRATTALLDRLLNSARLAVDDHLRSGVVSVHAEAKKGDKKPELVLAELTGPGAVVRVARSGDQGRLAFYFDGEEKPRLECKPGELWQAGPPVTEDRSPTVTCITYNKSLRIVLRDARQADYRIDYVTVPEGAEIETYVDPHSGFPRGLLSSVEYRLGQSWWGVIRQYDPAPRIVAEPKTIEPGKTEKLAHVDGSGIVQWLQLNADRKVLTNRDLWLEVTVDGESTPAIAAPVRYFFPGFVAQGRYRNFVLFDRGGPMNRLAMPFGAGLSVSVRNTGKKAIRGVGVTLSVLPDEDKEATKRMRLRGVYTKAGEGGDALVDLQGAGRWIGLICQQPDDAVIGIERLVVDGRDAPGWKAANLDEFLGLAGDFRSCLSGRIGPLGWRYLLLAPVDFEKSLKLEAGVEKPGDRLVLFYGKN